MKSVHDLIETYWDVKLVKKSSPNAFLGFNRNILGCKAYCTLWFLSTASRFNRNILGCKDISRLLVDLTLRVDLIETYWDVKTDISVSDYLDFWDLIETYWDVKDLIMNC